MLIALFVLVALAMIPNIAAPIVARRLMQRSRRLALAFEDEAIESGANFDRGYQIASSILADWPLLIARTCQTPQPLDSAQSESDPDYVAFSQYLEKHLFAARAILDLQMQYSVARPFGSPYNLKWWGPAIGAYLVLRWLERAGTPREIARNIPRGSCPRPA